MSPTPSPVASSPASPSPNHSYPGLWPRSTNLAYDSTRGDVVLFGGATASGIAGDTWTRRGSAWTQQHPASNPPERSGAVLVDDPEMHAVLLFGGRSTAGAPLNDTWAWNGVDWSRLQPAHSPQARYGAAATFDAVRHVVLMFGGEGLDDTWIWNGQDWSQASPAQSPPSRMFGRLAVDVAHGEAVLFGGFEARQDTWTWDGVTWSEQHPASTPPGIHEATPFVEQMVYDAGMKAIVFAVPSEGSATETWTWTGTDWSKLSPTNSPPPRDGAGMAYDAAASMTILAGGFPLGPGDAGVTWGWDGTTWKPLD